MPRPVLKISIKQGEPEWSLLGVDGVEHLPALQWKLINVVRMEKQKRNEAIDKLRAVLDS